MQTHFIKIKFSFYLKKAHGLIYLHQKQINELGFVSAILNFGRF